MASNLFSFKPNTGVRHGIRPVPPQFDMMKGRIRTAYIPCGDSYLQIDKDWDPPYRDGMLFEGSLRTIVLDDGRTFEVLTDPGPETASLYLFVDLSPGGGTQLVKAAAHIEVLGGARVVTYDSRSGHAFLEFQTDLAVVFVWSPDGRIFRFIREDTKIEEWPLTDEMMAWQRTEQLREQIKGLDPLNSEHLRRHHGIIASAIRILRVTRHEEARDILLQFLLDQCGMLTDRMRDEIHQILLKYNHPSANLFSSEARLNCEARCGNRRKPHERDERLTRRERLARPHIAGSSRKGQQHPPKKKA